MKLFTTRARQRFIEAQARKASAALRAAGRELLKAINAVVNGDAADPRRWLVIVVTIAAVRRRYVMALEAM